MSDGETLGVHGLDDLGYATVLPDWEPARWWRAVLDDGSVWAESSDEQEVREHARRAPSLCVIQRLMRRRVEERWEDASPQMYDAAGPCEPGYHRAMPGGQRCRCGEVVADPRLVTAHGLVEYALRLRTHGERAPGGNETWAAWDRAADAYVRYAARALSHHPSCAAVQDRKGPCNCEELRR